MKETRQLFKEKAYQKEFTATVLACKEEKNGFAIVLDQTVFFPEGGGQYGDQGSLNGMEVLDTKIKEGIIYHKTKEPIKEGTVVKGVLNWERRYGFMQNHSAEHIMSGLVHQIYGYDNVGFHLGEEEMTLDFNGELSMEQLLELEKKVNKVIWQNMEVKICYPTDEELEQLKYRSKKELQGSIRIVIIEGVDICACCATHVHKTGEIGCAKVISVIKNKQGVRVTMLAGKRALKDYEMKHNEVTEISKLLSVKPDKTYETVLKLQEEKRNLEHEFLSLKLSILKEQAQNAKIIGKVALMETKGLGGKELRELCNILSEKGIIGAVLNRKQEKDQEFQYLVSSQNVDVRPIAKLLQESMNGRGGGKAPMIQGTAVGFSSEFLEQLIKWSKEL